MKPRRLLCFLPGTCLGKSTSYKHGKYFVPIQGCFKKNSGNQQQNFPTIKLTWKLLPQVHKKKKHNITKLFFEKDKNFKQTKAIKRTQKINGESELQNGHPKGGNGKTEYEWVSYFCSVWCFKDCSYQSLEIFISLINVIFPGCCIWGMAVVSVLNSLFLLTPPEIQAGGVIFTHIGHHNLHLTTKASILSNTKTLRAFLLISK